MKSVLNELYELLDDGVRSPEMAQAEREVEPWAKRLEELTADDDEFDGIWAAAVHVGESELPLWFARGFRLGARVMLEVLRG